MINTFEVLKQIYKEKNYIYLTIVSGIISFFIFYKLLLAKIADNSLRIFIMMSGYNYTYFTLLSLVIISSLFGVYLSLIVYKFNLIKNANKRQGRAIGFFGFLGFAAGAFGTGCPTCGSVVFALVGAPLALMYFPFRGMELRILSIIILFISIYFLSKSILKCDAKV